MKIFLKGIPSNAGGLYPGTEAAPTLLRKAGLIEKLSQKHDVTDLGDVVLPEDLPKHNIPPIRNWPAPRIVWEKTIDQLDQCFSIDSFTVILGGGCNVFTGVFSKFHQLHGPNVHIISIDNHIDIRTPRPDLCIGATAHTLWFLTEENTWFKKPSGYEKHNITALGFDASNLDEHYDIDGINMFRKDQIYQDGVEAIVEKCLASINSQSKIILHLDLDVIRESDLTSVYSPSPNGMDIDTVAKLVKMLITDSRVLGIVITEFSGAYESSVKDASVVTAFISDILS